MSIPEISTYFSDNYELKEVLGKGSFSIVKKCVRKTTKIEYAVKIIETKKLTQSELEDFVREGQICQKLTHPNIISYIKSVLEQNYFYLIFELVTGGDLFDDIVTRKTYSEMDASYYIQQVLYSLNYCHKKNVIHRDLKPENLLLSSKSKDAKIKLIDFGMAITVEDDKKKWHGFCGTPGYISPEVLNRQPYGKAVDIWACGVILNILLIGVVPFNNETETKAGLSISGPAWATVTADAKELILRMLTVDSDNRITAEEALQNSWISQREDVASVRHRRTTLNSIRNLNSMRRKTNHGRHHANGK